MASLPFSYRVRRSARATKIRIVVSADKIEVVAPPMVAEHRLHEFVNEKQQWIVQTKAKMAEKTPPPNLPPAPQAYTQGTAIPYQGRHYPLTITPHTLKRVRIDFADTFTAYMPETLPPDAYGAAIRPALSRWLQKQTLAQVEQVTRLHSPRRQLIPRSIIVKTQRSRWGSCGIHNDININWLLIMAPPEVLEYVVVHELCHIQIRDHSARFWALVAEHLPDYRQHRGWLKRQGGELMRYGLGMLG